MKMKKMIGALTAKFAVALMAFGCITGAWAADPVVTFLLRDEVGDMTISYDSSVYTMYTQDGVERSGAAVYNYMTQTVTAGGTATEPAGEPSYWYHSGKTFPEGNNVGIPFSVEQSQAYVFDGWRLSGTDVRYDFTTPVTSNITLVPHFSAVEAVFEIYTEADLIAFAREVTLGRSYRSKWGGFPRQTVKLMNNITLTSNWTPIPGNFRGIFDGNGYAISGLVINDTSDETGFFRTSGNGGSSFEIKDLTFQNPQVTSSGCHVGVLAGKMDSATISNVTINNPTVQCTSTDNVGGLVGSVNNNVEDNAASGSTFSGCSVNGGTISCTGSDGRMVGGLIGQGVRYLTITDCSVSNVTINGYRKLGGLIGQANGTHLTCTDASVSRVTLNALGDTSYAKDLTMGGFVGQFATPTQSTITGTVSDITMTGPESIASGKNYIMGLVSGGTAGTAADAETAMTNANMTFDVTVSGTNDTTIHTESTYAGINGTAAAPADPVVTFQMTDSVGKIVIQGLDDNVHQNVFDTWNDGVNNRPNIRIAFTQTVEPGGTATKPTNTPYYDYNITQPNNGNPKNFTNDDSHTYTFDGWATSDGALYDFDTPVTENLTLHPRFSATGATILINNETELRAFAREVELGRKFREQWGEEKQTVKLANDITLTGSWTPVAGFEGIFDGDNHSISGLVISATGDNAGFFSGLNSHTVVKDLTFVSPTVTSTDEYVGVLAGSASSNSSTIHPQVSNVNVTGAFSVSGENNVGALIGQVNAGVQIEDCTIAGTGATVTATGSDGRCVGGLLGNTNGAVSITDCSVSGVTVEGYRKIGGLIGQVQGNLTCTDASVSNVTLQSDATTSYAKALTMGGLVGIFADSTPAGTISGTVSDVTMSGPANITEGKTYVMGLVSGGTGDAVATAETKMSGMTFDVTVSGTNTTTINTESSYAGIYGNPSVTYVAQIVRNSEVFAQYESLAAAFGAAQNGDIIELLSDAELSAPTRLENNGTYVVDGKGFTISPAANASFGSDGALDFGHAGVNSDSAVDTAKVFTLTNAVIAGFNSEIIRCEGCVLTIADCVFTNNNITVNSGRGKHLVRIACSTAAIQSSIFTDNAADGYGVIYIDEQHNNIQVRNCLFKDNVVDGTAVIDVAHCESMSIVDSTFEHNTLNSSNNGAVVYLGAKDGQGDNGGDCTGCLFKDNVVNYTTTSGYDDRIRAAGAIFTWAYGSNPGTISGNAFVNNSVVKKNANVLSCYAKSIFSGGKYNAQDLAGNYFGGSAPKITQNDIDSSGNDIYAELSTYAVTASTYAESYTLNDNNYGVTVTLYVPPVAQIGQTTYESLAAAVADVPTDGTKTTITMIADSAETVGSTIAATKNVVLDLNGKTVNYASGTPTITVLGSLTVDDSSVEASGCIKNTAVDANGAANGWAIYCDAGSVTVDNGTVGSLDTYRAIVVDHVGTVVVNDGSVIASNAAIRSTAAAHDVITINGGTIGDPTTDYAVYDYDYATISIHGGVLNADKIAIAAFGSTLTIDGGEINKYGNTEYAILLGEAGTATISAGTINSAYTGIFMGDNGTTLNITGGTITAANQDGAIGLNGTKRQTATINISGGTIVNTGTGAAIYQPVGGTTVNVSGNAVLTGSTGIAIKGGTLNVTGGTISATGPYTAPAAVNSGATSTGDAVYVEDTYGPGDYNVNYAPTVNITGGTLSSVNGYAAQYFTEQTSVSTYKANGSINITGDAVMTSPKPTTIVATTVIPDKVIASAGYFSSEVPAIYCAANRLCTTKPTASGMYQVVPVATVTYTLAGDGDPTGAALPDPEYFAYPSGDLAEIALAVATCTSSDYTFAGWKIGGTGDAIAVLPSGTAGNVTLVATWTRATKIQIDADGDSSTPLNDIKVTDEWIAYNVNVDEGATPEEKNAAIKQALETQDNNGFKKWENYVLGLDANAKVGAVAEQGLTTMMPVESTVRVTTVDTGFTVKYQLNEVDEAGETVDGGAGTPQDSPELSVDLSTVESNAYYKVVATIKSPEGETMTTATSENIIGVLKVESSVTTTAVAVPWASYDGTGPISVADIVRTANLTEGDSLKAYDLGSKTYKEWTLGADKTWQPSSTISTSGSESAGNADAYKVARGSAVWLTRADPSQPIYLVGGAASGTVETELEAAPSDTKSSWNLVGNPTVEPVDVKDLLKDKNGDPKTGDQVIVPTAGAPKNYVYVNGEWGYYKTVPYEIDGVKVGVQSVFTTDDTYVPAGAGFWYLNSSKSDGAKISW